MFTVYILLSNHLQKRYIGYTSLSVDDRLKQHLYKHKGFTANAKDWTIVYKETVTTKTEALRLERIIKKRGAKRYLNDIASR
tara:strand:- start:5532 stop:5777 length:246 start_codon:yes stop_codon:yes gene_type:complete